MPREEDTRKDEHRQSDRHPSNSCKTRVCKHRGAMSGRGDRRLRHHSGVLYRAGVHCAGMPSPHHVAGKRAPLDANIARHKRVKRCRMDCAERAADKGSGAGEKDDDRDQTDGVAVDIGDDGNSLHGALLWSRLQERTLRL